MYFEVFKTCLVNVWHIVNTYFFLDLTYRQTYVICLINYVNIFFFFFVDERVGYQFVCAS